MSEGESGVDAEEPRIRGWDSSDFIPPLKLAVSSFLAPEEEEEENDVEKVLSDPNSTVIDLLECTSIVMFFRENNQRLNDKFMELDTMSDILELFKTTRERQILSTLSNLYLSTNLTLLKTISQSVEVVNRLSLVLLLREPENFYRVGVVSRIISMAINKWPEKVFEIFPKSPIFYPTLLQNIDISSVYSLVLQIIQTPPFSQHCFIYGFLATLIGTKIPPPPDYWDIKSIGISRCANVHIESSQRIYLFKLFKMIYLCFSNECPLSEFFGSSLVDFYKKSQSIQEKESIMDLGLALPFIEELYDIATDNIIRASSSTPLLEKSLEYLTKYHDGVGVEPVIDFMYKLLSCSYNFRPNNFIYEAVLALITDLVPKAEYPIFFAKSIQQLITYFWNRVEKKPLIYRTYLLSYATVVGRIPTWPGWASFKTEIIDKYVAFEEIQEDFKIPEEEWDDELIESIVKGKVVMNHQKDLMLFRKLTQSELSTEEDVLEPNESNYGSNNEHKIQSARSTSSANTIELPPSAKKKDSKNKRTRSLNPRPPSVPSPEELQSKRYPKRKSMENSDKDCNLL